jgi:ABC-type spermidine/putrescine transport system permease subunit II
VPTPWTTAKGESDLFEQRPEPARSVRVALRQYRRLLDEGLTRALWLVAAKPADPQIDNRSPTGNGQIAKVPLVTAVERFRPSATYRAVCPRRIAANGDVPGVIIGLAMGLFSPLRAIVQPLIDSTFPIPKIAVLPLFIMVLGIGEESKYTIIAVAVVYLVLINTAAGVRNIDRIYMDVAKNFHASKLMQFTDIALPGALPLILTGLKLGMGIALLVIVSAEFVGAKSGIGYLIWTSWRSSR